MLCAQFFCCSVAAAIISGLAGIADVQGYPKRLVIVLRASNGWA